ncbi:hypothetical protein GY26_16180 [Gammaproteobacteria bacterium MFB021]|nr:hypothetical protein GY26_16180 [Gammaproteobacteria bacterium MFB021]
MTKNTKPSYSSWLTSDLSDEISRINRLRAELSGERPMDEAKRRLELAHAGARYHAATAELMRRAKPFDAAAEARRAKTISYHTREAERFLALALGIELPAGVPLPAFDARVS